MDLTLHGGCQGFESPRLHSKICCSSGKKRGATEATDKLRGLVRQVILQRHFRGAAPRRPAKCAPGEEALERESPRSSSPKSLPLYMKDGHQDRIVALPSATEI